MQVYGREYQAGRPVEYGIIKTPINMRKVITYICYVLAAICLFAMCCERAEGHSLMEWFTVECALFIGALVSYKIGSRLDTNKEESYE